jgi:hypothetical protein
MYKYFYIFVKIGNFAESITDHTDIAEKKFWVKWLRYLRCSDQRDKHQMNGRHTASYPHYYTTNPPCATPSKGTPKIVLRGFSFTN